MGRIEKLVVLVVLFLVAVVVAVSLNEEQAPEGVSPFEPRGDLAQNETDPPAEVVPQELPAVEPRPEKATPERVERSRPVTRTEPEVRGGERRTSRPNLLLDAGAETTPEPAGPARILKSTIGLEPSMSEQYREYRVRSGDTWTGLAQRFYHDARRAPDLQVANEDLTELVAGQRILVPVYDLGQEAAGRPRFVPVERPDAEVALGARALEREQEPAAPSVQPGTMYTVADGDNLSKISKKVYGTPNRWKAIYEANRDTMKSADWLQVGMRLRIPDLAALPPSAAPASTERDPNAPRVR